MDNKPLPQRLPPLNALRTFETVGRLQSVRGAAAELMVTPGAVSRQIRVLESWLGVSLFRHDGRSLCLTTKGARYLGAVTEHLAAIAEATDELNGRCRNGAPLQLRSSTLFATNWLVPRLTRFHKSQPWIKLELTTSTEPADFGRRDVDAEIRPGHNRWPGHSADWLMATEVVCVCSPDYLAEHQLQEPSDLLRIEADDILRSVAAPRLWQRWLDAAGVTGLDPELGPSFSDTVLTWRAAVAGHGVCLAPRSFIEGDLRSGCLVLPFPHVPGQQLEFYLVYPPDRMRRRAFRTFREWLLSELPQTEQGPVVSVGQR